MFAHQRLYLAFLRQPICALLARRYMALGLGQFCFVEFTVGVSGKKLIYVFAAIHRLKAHIPQTCPYSGPVQ